MKLGIDTGVLVAAHVAGLPEHEAVAAWLRAKLRKPTLSLVFTPAILHEFVHVATDPRRFDPPLTMAEAVAAARLWLGAGNVHCLAIEPDDLRLAFELIERHRLGRKRIADTLFAAALLRNEVSDLATLNPDDFRIFEDLRCIDPRRS